MFILLRGFMLSLVPVLLLSFPANAEQASREEIKRLNEQVQDIKTEALSIGVQMRQLEEKLLYPSTSQIAVYVSLDKAAQLSLDSLEIQVDGKRVAQHLYTAKELEALQKGGVQRIYVGNIASGKHDLQVLLSGKARGAALRAKESFSFSKDAGPRMLEVRLVDSAHIITLRDW